MRRPLPPRSAVLQALESQRGRLVHARDLASMLDVPDASYDGLLRMLDDLVFDGAVFARHEKFALAARNDASSGKSVQDALPSEHRAADRREHPGKPVKAVKLPSKPPKKSPPHEPTPRAPKTFEKPKAQRHLGERPALSSPREKWKPAVPTEPKATGGAPKKRGEPRAGTLNVNPRGFGFVASPAHAGDDVFVPAEALGGAMHGDHVIVHVIGRGGRGAEGVIAEVTSRTTTRVTGILRRKGKQAWVELDDPRVRGPLVLSREIDREGPAGNSGLDGQVVVATITRFPVEQGELPEGSIVAVLGQPGELSVEVRKVLMVAQIEEVHSTQAVTEAERYGQTVPSDLLEGREDLTHIPLPTIDPEDARDHDDAVWVEPTTDGGYEVWVAIADVSTYVCPGTQVDAEARARGCSIYLPDRAIPMLPRALSSNLCSLLPDVLRLCLCVHATLDKSGEVISIRLVRGYMKSAAKLTYGGVARALGFTDQPPVQPQAEAMADKLRVAYDLSRILRARRLERGALDFDLPEPVVTLNAEGFPERVSKRASDPGVKKAYQLIEELMIFANEAVARWLLERSLPGVYRVHLAPDPEKLERLSNMCEMLGIELDLEDTQTPKGLSETLKRFAKHPNADVLNNLLLRSMKQATYDVSNLGHFGLASDAYLHFTSPIRRYPDLIVHRIVHAALTETHGRRLPSQAELEDAALQSSTAERRAMEVERSILDIYRCFYMIDRMGERYPGKVSAFVGSGAFVTLAEPFVDVLIKTEDLGEDIRIADDGLSATGARNGDTIRLGDELMVEITDCAILRRTIYGRRIGGPSLGTQRAKPNHERGAGKPSRKDDARRRGKPAAVEGGEWVPKHKRRGKVVKKPSSPHHAEFGGKKTPAKPTAKRKGKTFGKAKKHKKR